MAVGSQVTHPRRSRRYHSPTAADRGGTIRAMSTDFELLDAWRGGDRVAGNELFERYFDAVFRFFRNKVSAAEVDSDRVG